MTIERIVVENDDAWLINGVDRYRHIGGQAGGSSAGGRVSWVLALYWEELPNGDMAWTSRSCYWMFETEAELRGVQTWLNEDERRFVETLARSSTAAQLLALAKL